MVTAAKKRLQYEGSLQAYLPIVAEVLVNDDHKVVGQYKRHPLSPHPKLDLKVAQKVAKVNVEQLAALCDHDVVRVTISNAKNIGGHAVAST